MKHPKYEILLQYLKDLKKVAIAFSGGVDSTFVLAAAKEALGDNVLAVTIQTPYIPNWEIEEAKEIVTKLGIKHLIIQAPILESIKNNPEDRCYLCKHFLFGKITEEAGKLGFNVIMDGTNHDDTHDIRPGMRALKELKVVSPLLENKLTKKEIREMSQELGLPTWDKPAYACLLTRLPYNEKVEISKLSRIEKAELLLIQKGIKAIRVRSHGDLARIEVDKSLMSRFGDALFVNEIVEEFKKIGFKYITLDLEGYRTGSFNN
jgi:pyridinium-3,5-biscarboxylic acid mononucleotide sulfurtransferase